MFPEGLTAENKVKFRMLSKFAFDSYHKGETRKVTFFEEDIPEGLVHFGFMNESTEMYACEGVQRTFSFLYLSLQEYLAAWYIANECSIEFQVAYHRLALLDTYAAQSERDPPMYEGCNKEEKDLISSLWPLGESLLEPAIFLAGITGLRCQSEDGKNPWGKYLSHDTAHIRDTRVLMHSLYEAQNPTLLPHYFAAKSSESRKTISIDSRTTTFDSGLTPYDCYKQSYCLSHSPEQLFNLSFYISDDNDASLLETFVKGLNHHSKSALSPKIKKLEVKLWNISMESSNRCLYWLKKAKCLDVLLEVTFMSNSSFGSKFAYDLILQLIKIQSFEIHVPANTSWEWLTALHFLSKLKNLHIACNMMDPFSLVQTDSRFSEAIESPCSSLSAALNLVSKSILRLNTLTKVVLSLSVSRETMAGVRSILLHCPSLTTLELKRTRLGYDGIIYIVRALRNNTILRNLVIYDDLELSCIKKKKGYGAGDCVSFSSMVRVPLPGKTTCTDFLLELNDILKDNTTLEEMEIQSGLFLPLSAGEGYEEYCQWTGLGPLQQFNVGAVRSGMSPNLRRSFSSSDLTQPQTQLFWDRQPHWFCNPVQREINFQILFALKREEKKKLFSLPSFTGPDTEVLQSFCGLDPRLKKCLGISYLHPHHEDKG